MTIAAPSRDACIKLRSHATLNCTFRIDQNVSLFLSSWHCHNDTMLYNIKATKRNIIFVITINIHITYITIDKQWLFELLLIDFIFHRYLLLKYLKSLEICWTVVGRNNRKSFLISYENVLVDVTTASC